MSNGLQLLSCSGRNFSLRWKDATPEKASKLFYSAEAISEASAAAGLLRQTHLLRLNVMQGEMKTLTFRLEKWRGRPR